MLRFPRVHRSAPGLASWALSFVSLATGACAVGTDAPPFVAPVASTPTPVQLVSAPPPVRVVEASLETVGLDGTALDRSVDPCKDFYQFACGGWLARTEIPADKAAWSRSFSVIGDRNEDALHQILDTAAKTVAGDADTRKIGAYYDACMDEETIESQKTKPLRPLLRLVNQVKDSKSLTSTVAELHRRKIWAFFDVSDTQDAKDATRVIAEIDQNGIGLPDRDYYLEARWKEARDKYAKHVERMMALAGSPASTARQVAEDVMRIEAELARASKSRVERREPRTMYNRLDREGLVAKAPHFSWDDYFKSLGAGDLREINVTSPHFLEGLDRLIETEKPAALRGYLAWHIVRSLAPMLPKAFVDESFAMEATLTGQKEQRTRWRRCVGSADVALGELVAQPFLKQNFSPESKVATERYVREISEAFAAAIHELDWMDAATKTKAEEKLKAMAYLIGYPKRWKTYDFEVKPKSFVENALAARTWDFARSLAKVGKPVDREEWHMTPPTVNAYYSQQMNHMVFPAGILQPPFYSAKASIPVNLGGMGMVVGHELTHGFDDQGSQYDGKGNLANWWSERDGARFRAKTDCIANQYAEYEPLPGLKLNGRLTLGENIADGGGVKLAFSAYRAMRKDAPEVVRADGFTEDQQFFLGVGQAWCNKQREENARLRAQTDPHSPGKFRVNGSLANLPEFSATFSCAAGTPMHRDNACSVW